MLLGLLGQHLAPDVSQAVRARPLPVFFERALSLDASRRPASVRQWLEELEAVL